jgi:hypothetical protein
MPEKLNIDVHRNVLYTLLFDNSGYKTSHSVSGAPKLH